MAFTGGWVEFGPYATLGQAYADGLAAKHFEQQNKITKLEQAKAEADAKVKEMEQVMLQKVRRIEELEVSEGKLQQDKDKLEKRNLHLEKKAEALEKKAEGLQSRILVIGDRKRLKARTEQEIFPMMHHLDTSVKTTQAANAVLKQRLEEALKNNGELEATVQDLQRRLREAAVKENFLHFCAEVPKDAGKEVEDCKRSLAYMLSPASMADWSEVAVKEPTEVEVRPRRRSEPPRPDVVFDKWQADGEAIEGIHEWLKEGLPPMTSRSEARLKIEQTEGLPEFIDVMSGYGLRYGLDP